jgi:hypothetical protein
MATNELWNVDSLEIPSTIAAVNVPSPSTTTTLSTKIAALEATRVTKAAEFDEFQSVHKELKQEVNETNDILVKDLATLQQLAAQTNTLLAAALREKVVIARIEERIDTIVGKTAPLHVEIEEIETQLSEKVTEAKKAREAEAKATRRSTILLECHRSYVKAFIKAMKEYYEFSDLKSTEDNCNIGPQTEAILLVFYDIPCFFSRTELELFLGYKSPNHNVDRALTKMVEEKCLLKQLTR